MIVRSFVVIVALLTALPFARADTLEEKAQMCGACHGENGVPQEKTTPVIAKHDFADGDDVPGSIIAMGPGIKHDLRLMGFQASVYDVATTILHIYGIDQPKQMRGHVLTEIFENSENKVALQK